ncbi:MAG TPA: galactitol-1-phosphate 5-dehydrogenase [Cyclobacteriaceae bacterium]|nr:galactitol-1-phosphate 5-dehydrogenase [Cyclobacteriaceae bacterium]
MKALVLEEYKKLTYKDVPSPTLHDNEVLVKVKAVGICGSDVHGMDGSTGRRIPPLIMGHEASGVIEKVGPGVKNWMPGDRVTFDSTIYNENDWYTKKGMYNLSDGRMVLGVSCKEFKREGAFAEYVAVPQHILHRIPDNVAFTQAAMVEPAAVALHAISLTPIDAEDAALVIGAGMVGMFVIQLLKIKGCKKVIAIDPETDRLEKARQCGADFIFSPGDAALKENILSVTAGRGADVAFEVVGITETIKMGIDLMRKGGVMTLVGNVSPNVEIPLQAVVSRQLRLQGSCAINGEYPEILALISSGALNVNAILSVEAPLNEAASWFDRLYNKEKGLMKVILKPS